MAVNESVYGSKSSWIPLSTGSGIKLANFGDGDGTIAKGFSTGKLEKDTEYDNSIVHSALGNESAISRMRTFKGGVKLTEDNFSETQWAFATGKNYFRAVDDTYLDTSTNMLSPVTNSYVLNSNAIPFTDFSYKNIRAVIGVNARETKTGGDTFSGGLSNYCENYATSYPYVTQIRITLFENIDGTWNAINFKGNKGIFIFNETSYFSKIRTGSKTFESGIIGSMMCCSYQSTSDTSALIIGGVLTQEDNRIYKDDIDIVSGDFDVFADSERGYFYYDTTDKVQEFREYCWQQVACFGIQFCEHSDNLTIDLESEYTTQEEAEKIFFGVLDDNYVGHGDFIRGKAIVNDKRYNKNADDNEYNPSKPTSNLNSKRNNTLGVYSGGKMYVVNELGIDSLINALCGAMTGDIVSDEDRYKMSLNFGDKSPLDYVTSFRFCPFTITGGTATNTINVFNKPITASSAVFHPLLTSIKRVTRSINVIRLFDDFRAYAPYTSLQLYVPFCDTIELNPSEWYGAKLTLDYFFNLSTGDVTCSVMRNNLDFAVLTGTFLYDIPLTAENNNAYRIAISSLNIDSKYNDINTLISQVNSGANVISNAVTGNVGGMLSGFTSMINNSINHAETREKHELQYQATKPSLCKSGSANATNNFMLDFDGKLIYKYRDFDIDLTNYADTVGYACLENGSLSECSHLTKMTNTKIDVSLPQDIINAMTSALNTGIIM